jgi:tricorn protease
VRFLSFEKGTLCFSLDGKLGTMKEGQEPKKLVVDITTQQISNSEKFISIIGGVKKIEIFPKGKEITFITRGSVLVTSVEESFTIRIANTI